VTFRCNAEVSTKNRVLETALKKSVLQHLTILRRRSEEFFGSSILIACKITSTSLFKQLFPVTHLNTSCVLHTAAQTKDYVYTRFNKERERGQAKIRNIKRVKWMVMTFKKNGAMESMEISDIIFSCEVAW
jgi:hypothetical protein